MCIYTYIYIYISIISFIYLFIYSATSVFDDSIRQLNLSIQFMYSTGRQRCAAQERAQLQTLLIEVYRRIELNWIELNSRIALDLCIELNRCIFEYCVSALINGRINRRITHAYILRKTCVYIYIHIFVYIFIYLFRYVCIRRFNSTAQLVDSINVCDESAALRRRLF